MKRLFAALAGFLVSAQLFAGGMILPQAGKFNTYDATTAPTIYEDVGDGYEVGSYIYDTTADKAYVCLDNTSGAAVWIETTAAAGAGAVSSVFTRTGAVVAASNDYTWAQIDKTTSDIADITTTIAGQGAGTVATGDLLLMADIDDSNNLKKITAQSVADLSAAPVDSVFGRTGAVVAVANDYTWAEVDKTTSDIADITTKSHTSLTDKGTNTHAQIDSHIAATSGAHGITGSFVGTTDTQTLSAKTLTTPTIGDFTNATHTHQNNAGGGQLDHGLAITGLADDDHTQYALLAGRSGGQSLAGSTDASESLTLKSTTNGTKGSIVISDIADLTLVMDGTTPAARKAVSMDLQVSRSADTQTIPATAGAENYIIGGSDNTLSATTTLNGILGGFQNTISGTAVSSFVIGGRANQVQGGQYNIVAGGQANVISARNYGAIFGGSNNTMAQGGSGSEGNVIIGGDHNTMPQTSGVATYNTIAGGLYNTMGTAGVDGAFATGYYNDFSHNYVALFGRGGKSTADFDFVHSNNSSATSSAAANVDFRIAGDTSDVHIGRQTNQAAVPSANNALYLHTTTVNQQSNYIAIKASGITSSYTEERGVATGTIAGGDGAGNVGDLNTSVVELVAAQGVGKVIIVDEVQLFMDWESAQYDSVGANNIQICYDTSNYVIMTIDGAGLLDANGSDEHAYAKNGTYLGDTTEQGLDLDNGDNEGVYIKTDAGDIYGAAGDSPLKYRVIYHVISYLN